MTRGYSEFKISPEISMGEILPLIKKYIRRSFWLTHLIDTNRKKIEIEIEIEQQTPKRRR